MLKRLNYSLILLTYIIILCGCSSNHIDIQTYANQEPPLTIQKYLSKKISGSGMLFEKSKKMVRRYKINSFGKNIKDNLILTQSWMTTDGYVQNRVWCLHVVDKNHFVGVGSDVTGLIIGEQYGNAVHLQYQLSVAKNQENTNIFEPRNELIGKLRKSPIKNIYSLLNASSIISVVKNTKKITGKISIRNRPLDHRNNPGVDVFCENAAKKWDTILKKTDISKVSAPQDSIYYHLDIDEWLFSIDNDNVLGRMSVNKRGSYIGELLVSYRSH